MSLEHLPLELFQAIAEPLSKWDHLALCLVSKQIRPFAQPYLYTSISIIVSAARFRDEVENSATRPLDKRRRDSVFYALRSRPHLANHIRSLHLTVDPHALNSSLLESTKNLLTHSIHLKEFTLSCSGDVPLEILHAVSNTVKSVKVAYSPFSIEGLHILLSRLDTGVELDLGKSSLILRPLTEPLSPVANVTALILSPTNGDSTTFLTAFIPLVSSLSSFSGPLNSLLTLRSLPLVQLSNLTQLKFTGEAAHTDRKWGSPGVSYSANPMSFLTDLATLLDINDRLESLDISIEYCYHFPLNRTHTYSILSHLPKSITSLRLNVPYLIPIESILPYLGSTTRSVNILNFSVSLFTFGPDDPEHNERRQSVQAQAEELCQDRGIRLTWLRWV